MTVPAAAPLAVDLSILVVSWRTRDLLRTMLHSVRTCLDDALADLVVEVVVVDNASGDGTAEMLSAEFDDSPFILLLSRTNTGFSGGNNQAFARSTGRMIVVANPDLVLDGPALRRLYDHALHHREIGLLTADLIGEDGQRQNIQRALPTLGIVFFCFTQTGRRIDARVLGRRFARRYRLTDRPTTGRFEIEQAAGALLIFRRSLVDHLDGYLFDEDLPILFSDVDLSRRVSDAGRTVVLDADEHVVHHGSGSLRQIDADTLDRLQWTALRAYFRKHGRPVERIVINVFAHGRTDAEPTKTEPAVAGCPLVSIVVISYNYAAYLPEAIDSALAQDHREIEVLVVDDGSTDETPRVAMAYADRGVRYLRKPNGGLSQARNFGTRHAHGEWIVFLDADDQIRPSMVSRCLEAARGEHVDLAFPQFHMFGAEERVSTIAGWDVERLKAENYIHATFLVRRDLALAHPYDEANRVGWEDWDFLLTLAETGHRAALTDTVLIDYRRHDANMTGAIRGAVKRDLRRRVLRRHWRFVGVRRWLQAERDYGRMWFGQRSRAVWASIRRR